ncbi:MAG: PAS domain-containing protein [Gammaproteobacteria bacterium]|nr:PAS domain-containing protein [Gammaproteobacteria bacterium]
MVGIGASAGGLEAVSELIKHMPVDIGMAFVLVQHLAPKHESMLSELLARETAMPVQEIKDGMAIERNRIYVIPPNTNLGILHGMLHLMPRSESPGQYLPIDFFLRSLAREMSNRSIGIILSGSASDGVLGLMEIKAAGGITFAQDEASAAYASMPHSAIAAGCVDFVLPPKKIASELARIGQHPYLVHNTAKAIESLPAEEDNLRKIYLLLRQHSGNDFTYYKQSTILRRIKRRILLHKLERLEDYLRLLQNSPTEVEALFRDLLINVTGFFRDPEVFDELIKTAFPAIMKNRPVDAPIRIWIPGCSTGEEVYSIAISLFEFLGDMAANTAIQFFATDLDEQAVDRARNGIYPATISEVVSANRLQRFFTKKDEGYQISKHIRDVCIFAQQNVLKDPPFSRLDLISCRNLLIYLSPVLQKKIIPIFHYALNDRGYLLLGTSETIGRHADLFRMADKKHKLYEKKSVAGPLAVDFTDITMSRTLPGELHRYTSKVSPQNSWTNLDIQREADRIILKKYSPPGVVVNEDLDVLQFRGHTGAFLEPAAGEASLNLLKMARNGLQLELRNAVNKVIDKNTSVRKDNLRLQTDSGISNISIEVDPISGPTEHNCCYLISFLEADKIQPETAQKTADDAALKETGGAEEESERQRMQQELAATREYLHSVIEQQEVTNEELTSANEEIQASNEELQSTNEELETAKEELQSSNEELSTVNDELGSRNIELEQLSNDLTNLISGLSIPIVMVNEELCIRRFSTSAEKMLNLIPSDLGRPITHIKANVTVPHLEKVLLDVIDTVSSEELEVQDNQGHWYSVHIRPYKTLDNKISGAVIAFLDINEMKQSLVVAERAQYFAEAVVAAVRYPMLVLDKHLRVVSASEVYYSVFQVLEKETIGNLLYHLGNGQWGIPQLRQKLETTIEQQQGFDDYLVEHEFESIGKKQMRISGRPVSPGMDDEPMVLMQIVEITGGS